MIDFSKFDSLISLMTYFNSDEVCKKAIVESRWTDGDVTCPYCGGHHCVTRKDGKFRCKQCRRNFSCFVGTIFENTKLPLIKWFMAMYLISSHKKGISSYQLSHRLTARALATTVYFTDPYASWQKGPSRTPTDW